MKSVLNDLFDYGLKIYQYEDKFKFSLDSILLAEFVEFKKNTNTIVDFCTGNAPVPLILSTKMNNIKLYGFEIQQDIAKLARLSVRENGLDNQIKIIEANIKDALEYLLPESVDAITCNPPYFKVVDDSIINEDKGLAIARHEITMTLEDIMISAKYLLRNKGCFYLVHRCDRLEEILLLLNKYSFKVKKIQFIYAGFDKDAIMVLIKATKNGKTGSLSVPRPIDVMKYKSYKGIFNKEG